MKHQRAKRLLWSFSFLFELLKKVSKQNIICGVTRLCVFVYKKKCS